jgi:adenine-specific DNA-methyltransferase
MNTLLADTSCDLLKRSDDLRKSVNTTINTGNRASYAQFMTPAPTAVFMASLFPENAPAIRLLDPGAGTGSLTAAFVARFADRCAGQRMEVDAFEVDHSMLPHLRENLEQCAGICKTHSVELQWVAHNHDFIIYASRELTLSSGLLNKDSRKYTHCIMNPPYKKIASNSQHRKSLRTAGIETVNLYSGFVALAIALLHERGNLVAIVPRSFCNGPYYRPFRKFLLNNTAIRHLHLFGSRNSAFREDKVLQENVIIQLERGSRQKDITVSTSTDDTFSDIATASYSFESIVQANDPELFIHIPTSPDERFGTLSKLFRCSLDALGIQVSTGPVVDFRLKPFLRDQPSEDTVPMLYPCHFSNYGTSWPMAGKKPNAIALCKETRKWLLPNGFYTVVRRFSSKEEKRRIVASTVTPEMFDTSLLGFENHLNVFHIDKRGLPKELAFGLTVFLNATCVDQYFRRFSGHTQVNATDLRLLKYPDSNTLFSLGTWAMSQTALSLEAIDRMLQVVAE